MESISFLILAFLNRYLFKFPSLEGTLRVIWGCNELMLKFHTSHQTFDAKIQSHNQYFQITFAMFGKVIFKTIHSTAWHAIL